MQKKSLRALGSLLLAAALAASVVPAALAAGEDAAPAGEAPAAETAVPAVPDAAGGENQAVPAEEGPSGAREATQEQVDRATLAELAKNGQLELPEEFELSDYAELLDMADNVKVTDLDKTGTAASFIGADLQPYFRLRDLAYVFTGSKHQFNVSWNGQVVITTGAAYDGGVLLLPVRISSAETQRAPVELTVSVDGEAVTVPAIALEGHYYLTVESMNTLLGTQASIQEKEPSAEASGSNA